MFGEGAAAESGGEAGSIVSDAAAAAAQAEGAGGEGGDKEGEAAAAEKAAADKAAADKAAADAAAAAGDKSGKEGDAGKTGAPESYADFTLPKGVDLDPLLIDTAVPLFKEANLSQEQAQGMVDTFQKVREAEAEGFIEQRAQQDADLRKELGAEYEPTQNRISGMLARFSKEAGAETTAEISKLLHDDYGIGSNPALVKLLDFAARGLAVEDNVSGEGGQQGKGEKTSDADAAKELYGDSMYNEDGSLKNP
jgi:hypothetical protein